MISPEAPRFDFLIVGAMKCASTSLHQYLRIHPEIHMTGCEETGYFLPRTDVYKFKGMTSNKIRGDRTDPELMAHIIQSYNNQKLIGERCTDYTKFPFRAVDMEKIWNMNPDMKFLYIVRHPVERIVSNYYHFLRYRPDYVLDDIDAEIQGDEFYVFLSLYYFQMQHYFARFMETQFKVVVLEDLEQHPRETMSSIFRFLGVDSRFVIDQYQKYNVNKQRVNMVKQPLSEHNLKNLLSRVSSDAKQLSEHTGINLIQKWSLG